MTREEILSLKAGTALDKLIAERVFGLKLCGPPMGDWMYWTEDGRAIEVPDFSLDMHEAWQALGKIAAPHHPLNPVRLSQTLKGWCCRIRTGVYTHVKADGETAPLAICRAVLLVHLASQETQP